MRKSRIARVLVASFVAVALLAGIGLRVAPSAHAAATPTIVQSWTEHDFGNGDGGTLLFQESFTTITDVTSGDEVVFLIAIGGGNSYDVSGVTNNGGASFASAFSQVGTATDGLNDRVSIWAAKVSSGGSVNLELGFSGSGYVLTSATMVEISGQESALSDGFEYLSESGSGGTTHTTGSGAGLSTGNDELALAVYADPGSNATASVASGESALADNDTPTVNLSYAFGSASAPSHFTFNTSASASYALVAAASFGSV